MVINFYRIETVENGESCPSVINSGDENTSREPLVQTSSESVQTKKRAKSTQVKCLTGAIVDKRRSKSAPSRCAQKKSIVGCNLKYTSDEI